MVEHGVTGIVVAADDDEALAGGITELLSDPAKANRFGSVARERSERFGAERLVTDLDRLYRSLLREVRS